MTTHGQCSCYKTHCGSACCSTFALAPDVLSAPTNPQRYNQLLSSNYAPLDSEVTFIHLFVSATAARLAAWDEEVSHNSADEEHAMLLSLHRRYTSILSPLRRFPSELLLEIFSWTLPSANDLQDSLQVCMLNCPWNLTHVCQRWRTLTINTPWLWSLVVINYMSEELDPSIAFPLPILETQIARAQKLKIHFYGGEYSDPEPQIEAFEYLAEHSTCWEELTIGLTSQIFPLIASLQDHIPSLRKLSIRWEDPDTPAEAEPIEIFQTAPSLTEVNVYNGLHPISVLLPTRQLTHYQMDAPWETHWNILEDTPNLQEAGIIIPYADEVDIWPNAGLPIHLSDLRRIFISHSRVLDYISIPNIQDITVDLKREEIPVLQQWIASIANLCQIRRFVIIGEPTANLVHCILSKLSTVVELAIFMQEPENELNDIISQLTFTTNLTMPVLAPQIIGIWLGSIHEDSINYALYIGMIKSRLMAENCTLKHVGLADPGLDLDLTKMQDQLSGFELDFSLTTGKKGCLAMRDYWSSIVLWN